MLYTTFYGNTINVLQHYLMKHDSADYRKELITFITCPHHIHILFTIRILVVWIHVTATTACLVIDPVIPVLFLLITFN